LGRLLCARSIKPLGKLRFEESVNLCRQDEIALRQTVDLVRPGCDIDSSLGKRDIWVVSLLLSKLTHAIYEFESSAKIGRLEGLRDVMFFDDVPRIDLLLKYGEFLTLERGEPLPGKGRTSWLQGRTS
jgi:hypothetical protein